MKKRSLVTLLLTGIALCAGSTVNATDLNLTASYWQKIDGFKWNAVLNNDSNGFLYFEFGSEPSTWCATHGPGCDKFDYLYTENVPTNIAGWLRVKATISTSTDSAPNDPYAFFEWHTEASSGSTPPANFRLIVKGQNLDNPNVRDERWWSTDNYSLVPGTNTTVMNVPLIASHWTNVYGESADSDSPSTHYSNGHSLREDFAQDISNVLYLGMTFGGGGSAGHGVYLTPTASTGRFTVEAYQILPNCPATNSCSSGSPVIDFNDSGCSPGTDTGLQACGSLSCASGQHVFRRVCPCSGCGCTWSANYCGLY